MQRFSTLRARFALWVAGLLLVALVGFGALVYASMAQGLHRALDESLQLSAAQAIAGIPAENLNVEDGSVTLADSVVEGAAAAELRERGLTIRVLSPAGQLRQAVGPYRALSVDATALAAAAQGAPSYATLSTAADAEPVRVYTLAVRDTKGLSGFVQVAQSLAPAQTTLNQLVAALLIGVPLVVLVAGGGGYWLAARALAPIDQIARTAQRISANDLHARLNLPATNDEVGRLAGTFDGMLARLEGAFQRERQFTADASHELRTPLATMQAIVSVTRERLRTTDEYQQALDDLNGEVLRLRGLVEALLRLARGEQRQLDASERVELALLLNDVCETVRPLAEERGLHLRCELPAQLPVHGDSDALIRLFLNLLDNAVKYTARGSVSVCADERQGEATIVIRDTGMGIAAEHLPHLFERFYRVDTSRSAGGTGLGLAIASEIAQAHGGAIAVASAMGQGTVVTITLPALPSTPPQQ